MPALFNGDNSDSEKELKINTDYAKNYTNWRQKEELNKLKTKYGDINGTVVSDGESDTESSSSSEEENEISEQFDKDFYKTLAMLKTKDPKIYNQNVTFFDDTNKVQESFYEKKKSPNKSKKEKAVYLRDFERNIIVEREGKFSDSEDEDKLKKNEVETQSITYNEEQEQIKKSFKDALHDDDDDNDDAAGNLLKPKAKSEIEQEKEEADYKEWLKGQKSSVSEKEEEVLKPLRDFWSNPNLDENEKFLRDYVLNNKYLDTEHVGSDIDDVHLAHDSDDNLSEDEKNIEKQEEFEHKYNFRFEEPDQEFIKRFPRTMENSMRRKDTRRAQKRAEVKQRKEKEKLRKKEELKQLKALKRKEIEEKIEKLKEITGNEDIKFNDLDLEGDFDPNEYDKQMTEIFNNDYYAGPEEDIKPEFPDVDEELEIESTWDNYDPNTENYETYEDDGPHCEDVDFNMDADYDASKSNRIEEDGTTKRKRRRKSKFAELMSKKKPKFDPQQYKSYEEYFDKYYSLNYEDMIGDIPCRFKYRKVVPNDYGLSVEEILMADDKELNRWCSLKKALQYKPEHAELNDVQMYKQKTKNEVLKKKVLPSLYRNPEDEEEKDKTEDVTNPNTVKYEEKETQKKRRSKKKKQEVQNVLSVPENNKEKSNEADLDKRKQNVTNTLEMSTKESNKKRTNVKKRKQMEEQPEQSQESLQKKKKKKLNNAKQLNFKSDKDKEINKSLKKNSTINSQNYNEVNCKQAKKKMKLKEKLKNKKLNRKKGKGSKASEINNDMASLNPERLKTYGINPKKFKNKLKYGKKQY